ncbi:helix-turn-helix domain-containing protein [Cytophagaceae bacterium DM2B3-1]|uniref:Helix-turn-helix domain-containing protein n=1 Tax=Xanthocytophaga flava TaxID=3048013 RepID=A0ABT7CIX7_9BACT|nr:helix-turn-helix domain-containing protein [Xanthocytophaga flavus]MDJ1493683.1 helix-turn-helix domain-containing protein [Xanthocytophaga flavus]
MPNHSSIPNPFEELIARLSRLEDMLYELHKELISSKESPLDKEQIGGIELAMQLTGLARSTIYNLTSEGKIPYMKRGKKIYFSYQELSEWLRDGKRKILN